MFRKHLNVPGRRSSQPKRLSALVKEEEEEERTLKNASEQKRSLIPRSTNVSSRPQSMERDGVRSCARGAGGFARSSSVERLCPEQTGGKLLRARSNENLFTPKYSAKTPVQSQNFSQSVHRTARKDARPLADKTFQNLELAKAQEFLVDHNIITRSQIQELRSPITLKLFVHIMNSLLAKLYPTYSVTMSNYLEVIPLLMKKLKYPGPINRSWLVTANSPHAWPSVIGLISFLTNLMTSQTPDLKFVEDDVMDAGAVNVLIAYNKKTYMAWNEDLTSLRTEDDEQFFDELVRDRKAPLDERLNEIQEDVESLENYLLQLNSPEDRHVDEKLKSKKEELKAKLLLWNELGNKLSDIQHSVEKNESIKNTLKLKNEDFKKAVDNFPTKDICNAEEVAKRQSEAVSVRNIIKLQDTHETNINSECYTVDLVIARLQGKLEEVRLQRDGLIRLCTSEHVIQPELHISYGNDNSKIVAEFATYVKEKKKSLNNLLNELAEKEKSCRMEMNRAEQNVKLNEEELYKREAELQKLEKAVTRMKNDNVFESKRYIDELKEKFAKLKEEYNALLQTQETENTILSDMQKELKLLEETMETQDKKFLEILKMMANELIDFATNCVNKRN